MHLDYRCFFMVRHEGQWRKVLERLAIEGSDRKEYTFFEIGELFANDMRFMKAICDQAPIADIFDTVQSSEKEKYYFIHDHKKPPQYFSDLTDYIFEELQSVAPGDFILLADVTNFDDDSMGDVVWCYCGGQELQEIQLEDMDQHDVPVQDLLESITKDHLSTEEQAYLQKFLEN